MVRQQGDIGRDHGTWAHRCGRMFQVPTCDAHQCAAVLKALNQAGKCVPLASGRHLSGLPSIACPSIHPIGLLVLLRRRQQRHSSSQRFHAAHAVGDLKHAPDIYPLAIEPAGSHGKDNPALATEPRRQQDVDLQRRRHQPSRHPGIGAQAALQGFPPLGRRQEDKQCQSVRTSSQQAAATLIASSYRTYRRVLSLLEPPCTEKARRAL